MSSMYSISKDGWFCIPEGGSWYPSVIEFRKFMPHKAMRFIKNIFCKNGRLCGEISDKYKLKFNPDVRTLVFADDKANTDIFEGDAQLLLLNDFFNDEETFIEAQFEDIL